LLHGNRINHSQNYGIHIEAGPRSDVDGNAPHQGAVRHLDEINDEGLVPGVTVTNNLITHSGTGGIRFSGDANGAGLPTGAVPFGRIINNTIVGVGGDLIGGLGGADVGIQVDQNASPTLLNNIIVNTALGISVDASSNTTVIGGTLYQGNLQTTNYSGEDFAISITNADPLFVDPSINVNNFYLKPGTQDNPNRAIDSSVSSLGERFVYGQVKSPIGISPSPIIAPVRDVTGQLRVDDPDVEPPSGLGTNVFIDRGAIDRADFTGPVAVLINPKDNDADGIDQNNGLTVVNLSSNQVVSSFEIRLNDGQEPADPSEGIGIADNSVDTEKVIVRRNGELLKDGIDYSYSYNETNDTIRLTPLSGIWTPDRIYTIELANLDYWKIDAEAGININDGDSFLVRDLNGTNADFEFERGYSIQVPQTLQIQIPVEAGGLGGIVDGEFFSIKQGNIAPIQFEFDRDELG
jgi:parallel beta-helix repeat protein